MHRVLRLERSPAFLDALDDETEPEKRQSIRKHACDKVHLRQEIKASQPPGGDPAQKTGAPIGQRMVLPR